MEVFSLRDCCFVISFNGDFCREVFLVNLLEEKKQMSEISKRRKMVLLKFNFFSFFCII